jgi:long-chain acyl-CoA synthetase
MPMINLALGLERGAQIHADRPAIFFADRTLTYRELDAAVNRVANGLRALGIGRGDNVALACPNIPYFPIVYYGILKAGATVVPLSVLCKAPEFAYHLEDSQARAFFCFEGSAELPLGAEGHAGFTQWGGCRHFFLITADPAKPAPIEGVATLGAFMHPQPATGTCADTDANDTAVILYTSGTTGRPKGAELTHANLAMHAFAASMLMRMDGTDCHLVALPLFHSFGQSVQMNAVLWCGASMVLIPRFDPDAVLAGMQRHGVTIFAGVPTMYIAILHLAGAEERHDLKAIAAKLRLGISGGSAMPVEVMRRFEERYGIVILEGYGLSETSPVATYSYLDFPRIPGSVGKAITGTQVRIVDDAGQPLPPGQPGEIVVRGHNVMKGYYRRPAETAAAIRDGWFHTGDIGKMDEDNNFYVVDRIKDMVIRGGFNVYPRELEEVLMTHAAVAQVAVIGVPHEVHGEEVKAVLTLRPGQQATPEAIIAWCKERMAAYKYPRIVEIVDALPMTATGKILKRALKAT